MKQFILCLLIMLLFMGCQRNDKENTINQNKTSITNDANSKNNITMTVASTIINPKVVNKINIEDNELLSNLKELSKSPRKFDTDGEQRALSYLKYKMEAYGYSTKLQKFSVYRKTISDVLSPSSTWQYFDKYTGDKDSIGKGMNVVATMANPDKKRTLYITAHYDTQENTDGIRDNGSGVVVAMEIAKQLQELNLPINIEFIFFSAEEAGLQGSTYFVSQLTEAEKENALGCINLDVVGEKGENTIELKTFSGQINVLSLLMDEYHEFQHSRSEASDHTSFYMGEIPAIYFGDENVKTKDTSNNPLNEIDIDKLKELTQIICNFILEFNLDNCNYLLENSYTMEYTDLPDTEAVMGYILVQVNKILKENGAGSDIQYILKNNEGNKVIITEKDNRFLSKINTNEIKNFVSYNNHVKYRVLKENNNILVEYMDDWLGFKYNILQGNISEEDALELLNNQSIFINNNDLLRDFD